jgi:hypothetical protein
MKERVYTLLEMVRDPGRGVYEAWELDRTGHYTLYRYDAQEGVFYRATVPAGADAIHFFRLRESSKVPVTGWQRVIRRPPERRRFRVISGLG